MELFNDDTVLKLEYINYLPLSLIGEDIYKFKLSLPFEMQETRRLYCKILYFNKDILEESVILYYIREEDSYVSLYKHCTNTIFIECLTHDFEQYYKRIVNDIINKIYNNGKYLQNMSISSS